MFLKLLEPAWELKREIARIAHSLDFFANPMSGDTPRGTEAREGYRNHACALREKVASVVGYGFWAKVVLLPTKRDVMVASRYLIGLSNAEREPRSGSTFENSEKIRKSLGILRPDDFVG